MCILHVHRCVYFTCTYIYIDVCILHVHRCVYFTCTHIYVPQERLKAVATVRKRTHIYFNTHVLKHTFTYHRNASRKLQPSGNESSIRFPAFQHILKSQCPVHFPCKGSAEKTFENPCLPTHAVVVALAALVVLHVPDKKKKKKKKK